METLLTVPSFGAGSGSAALLTLQMDGTWDYWSVNDLRKYLERCGPGSARLHALGLAGRSRTGPSQCPFQCREPVKSCQSSLELCGHGHATCQQLRLSNVTQCPVRLASTSSPHLIFPEIWLMLALPPKKGCQGKRETADVVKVRSGREPNTVMQQEGRKCLTTTTSVLKEHWIECGFWLSHCVLL